jgi:hypothetical protein
MPKELKAPYTPSPKNVKDFFEKIKGLGLPPKVTNEYLKSIGFKSSNDRYLISVSKSLGFIDSNNKPTDKWEGFKDKKKAPGIMCEAMKTAYADLFKTYPDADTKTEQELVDYFVAKCLVANSVAKYMAQTFKNLGEFAVFGAVPEAGTATIPPAPAIKTVVETVTGARPITVNINIQLQLPVTEDAKIYDSLFKALKDHLFT